MKKTKRMTLPVLIALITLLFTPSYTKGADKLMASSSYARGAENQMKTIFMDTFYGMAAGALIATALSLTQDNPNWGENVGTGAAIGGIAGALFGIATEVRYLASIENGHLSASIPSIELTMDKRGENEVIYTAGIFQYKFK